LSCRIYFYMSEPHAFELRVLRGGAAAAAHGGEIAATRTAVRAGDRHDPWTFAATPRLRALAAAAAALGVDLSLAVRVVIERELALGDLHALAVDPAPLDGIARAAHVDRALDAASAAYVRRLSGGDGAEPRALGEQVTIGLPLRLSTRLSRAGALDALLGDAVGDALAWELAAVMQGRTISEWAALTALRGATSQCRESMIRGQPAAPAEHTN
jgi:hypothetical protein